MNGSQDQQNIQRDVQSADPHTGTEKEKTKRCAKCGRILPLDEFYYGSWKSKTGKRYRRSRCIKCTSEDVKEWKSKNPEKARERNLRYKEKDPAHFKRIKRRYYIKNKEKINKDNRNRSKIKVTERRAAKKLYRSVERGETIRGEKCEMCGETGIDILGHHPDYSKPLNVVWVCKTCHSLIHFGKSDDFKQKYAKLLITKKTDWQNEAKLRELYWINKENEKIIRKKVSIRLMVDEYNFLHLLKHKWGVSMSSYVCRIIDRSHSKTSKNVEQYNKIVSSALKLPKTGQPQKRFALVVPENTYKKLEEVKEITGVSFIKYVRVLLRSRM